MTKNLPQKYANHEKIMGQDLEIRLQTKKPEIKNAASLQSICMNGLNK